MLADAINRAVGDAPAEPLPPKTIAEKRFCDLIDNGGIWEKSNASRLELALQSLQFLTAEQRIGFLHRVENMISALEEGQ